MRILLTGATGFIGRHVAQALKAGGHEVVGCARRRSVAFRRYRDIGWIRADFTTDLRPADWRPRLTGFDAVVNAAGILREKGEQTFHAVHYEAPRALFQACADHGVKKIVQISALGCDAPGLGVYAATKSRLDDFVATLDLDWTVIRPSLVFGDDGPASRLLCLLARLPVIPLAGDGYQLLQPIHVDDLGAVVAATLAGSAPRSLVEVAGRRAITYREFLAALRVVPHRLPLRYLSVPLPLVRLGAHLGDAIGAGPFGVDTLDMLLRGNVSRANAVARLLGREPKDTGEFVAPESSRPYAGRIQGKAGGM
jgi:uncharacterized protein YbjT (DUF2867 family)